MSTTKKITIACWAVSALLIIGLVVWLLLGGGFHFGLHTGSFNEVGSESISAENVNVIDIDWMTGAVYIIGHSGEDIIITEFSQRNVRNNQRMYIRQSGDTVHVQFTESRVTVANNLSKRLEVFVPQAQLDSISVQTISGRVVAEHLSADNLQIQTTSGRIVVDNTQAETIDLRTVSGRIETRRTEAGRIRSQTTSGRHEINGAFGVINASSVSGRLELTSSVLPESVNGNTTSGRIELTIPNDGTINVNHSQVTGRFSSELPMTSQADADVEVTLSTTSGRISIYALR